MNNKKNVFYTIVVIFCSLLLLASLVLMNINLPSKKKNGNNETTTVSTTKKVKDLIFDKETEIIVNGEYVTIPLKTYTNSSFSIDYDITTFNIVNMSNGDVYIKDNENEENYIFFKTLKSEDYDRLSKDNDSIPDNDTYVFKTMYYKGEKYYLNVEIKYFKDDNTFNKINPRINYMLQTLHVN